MFTVSHFSPKSTIWQPQPCTFSANDCKTIKTLRNSLNQSRKPLGIWVEAHHIGLGIERVKCTDIQTQIQRRTFSSFERQGPGGVAYIVSLPLVCGRGGALVRRAGHFDVLAVFRLALDLTDGLGGSHCPSETKTRTLPSRQNEAVHRSTTAKSPLPYFRLLVLSFRFLNYKCTQNGKLH